MIGKSFSVHMNLSLVDVFKLKKEAYMINALLQIMQGHTIWLQFQNRLYFTQGPHTQSVVYTTISTIIDRPYDIPHPYDRHLRLKCTENWVINIVCD